MIQHAQLVKTADMSVYRWGLILGSLFCILFSGLIYRYKKVGIPLLLLMLGYLIIPEINFDFSTENSQSIYHKYYTVPRIKSPGKKNIIFIQLETMEQFFADPDPMNGENIIPNLLHLQQSGIYFDGWEQSYRMKPTLPSYVATNCGIPRSRSVNIQNNNHLSNPNVVCMTDILKKYGYDTTFIMGGHIQDEGANKFVKAHPYSTVMERKLFI